MEKVVCDGTGISSRVNKEIGFEKNYLSENWIERNPESNLR